MSKPRWLSDVDGLSERAAKHWKALAPKLHGEGELVAANAEKLRQLCRLIELAELASADISARGVTIGQGSRAFKANPAATVLIQAQAGARELMRELEIWDKPDLLSGYL